MKWDALGFRLQQLDTQVYLLNPCVLPHTFFIWKIINLREGLEWRMHYNWIEKRRLSPAPGGIQTHNLRSFAPQACALLLCHNRRSKKVKCPSYKLVCDIVASPKESITTSYSRGSSIWECVWAYLMQKFIICTLGVTVLLKVAHSVVYFRT